jgi:hypothetical protein
VTFEAPVDAIDKMVDWLDAHRYAPDLPGDGWRRTPDGDPICPRHGVAMASREKQGSVWHSHKIIANTGEELYCRGYPNPSSAFDGWDK